MSELLACTRDRGGCGGLALTDDTSVTLSARLRTFRQRNVASGKV
jgi:hypothetical protein